MSNKEIITIILLDALETFTRPRTQVVKKREDRNDFVWLDQIRSVAQSCPTLCDPMNRSTTT